MQQVVTIHPDGGMSGLQRKRGKGLDLRQFGRASIERVSEIVWCEDRQRWKVQVLDLKVAYWMAYGKEHPGTRSSRLSEGHRPCLTWFHWKAAGLPENFPGGCRISTGGGLMTWDDYDRAVEAEVRFLDALRLIGVC